MELIEGVLSAGEARALRDFVAAAPKRDGRATAGFEGRSLKACEAVAPDAPGYADALRRVERRALSHPAVGAIAFPRAVSRVQFLTYPPGGRYGTHTDHPLMAGAGGRPMRADLSATLFLNAPGEYEGGGLTVAGREAPRGRPGDLLLYDGGQRHGVASIGAGERIVAVFWIESFVADPSARRLLIEFDRACQPVRSGRAVTEEERTALTDVYSGLLRRFSSER